MKNTLKRLLCTLLAVVLCTSCITAAAAEMEARFDLAGANMTLGNELHLNFFIRKSDLHSAEGCTATIVHNGAATQVPVVSYNSVYYAVSHAVAAKQMADAITVQIFDADGNALSNVYTDSVRGYAMRVLEDSSTTDMIKVMMVDMLNYGTAAQSYFEYNTTDPANRLLTDVQLALATDKVNCINGQIKGKNCFGSNLSLEDQILLNMFFSGMADKDRSSMYATISFTGFDGVAHNITVPGSEFVRYNADTYRVVVDDIVLGDSDCPVTVTVYNADGTIHGYATDSVESYTVRAAASNSLSLYANIMKFFRSAYAYLADKNGLADHGWNTGELTKAPTDTEIGSILYTCLDDGCGATKTKALPKTTDHDWAEDAVNNQNGTHTVSCTLCGTSKSEAHIWDDGVGDSTQKLFTCTVCAATKTEMGSLSAEQIALLQSFTYTKGNMSAAANVRQAPPHYADTVYAAICMDGLAEKFTSYTAAGALSQAFRLMEGSDYGNFDRTYVLRTKANGYISENGTAYQVASMVVDGFYGGPWLTDADGTRLTDRGAQMDIHDLQPGDVLIMGENTGSYDALLWVMVYQGVLDGQHVFMFGNTYYGGNYTNVSATASYRGKLCFDAKTGILERAAFNNSISSTGTEVTLTTEGAVGTFTFNDWLREDLVSGVNWEYFYALRPGKILQ